MDATFGGYYDIPLIALISCAEEVISKWQDKIYFITHDETFKELIDVELPDFEINISVSTLAIEFAKYIGANPIIVIGQDLGFTPEKEYSKTCNVYEDTKRLENVDVEKSDLYELVPGYYEGETVLSTTVFTAIKRWMQRFIKYNPNIEFINATEGGAKIIGTIQMPLKKAIEKYNKSKYNSDYEPKLLFPEPIDVEARLEKTVEKLEEQKELVQKIIEVSKELMHEYTQYQPETSPEKIREIYPKLYNLEVELSKLEVERISRYMFEKLSYDISKDEEYKQQARRSDVENAIKITEGNVLIYKALELAISDAIDRINNRIGLESAENE
ncbi:hypothetical protein AN642_00530 [Epulopiscium sp. SCG-B10WGA-EpuloA2]|nr:hypothetical protein AN642_00530 [Epulopiscium sp. SCG-B10WGA-EpuloA2]